MTIARLQKAADLLAAANLGYDQADRWSFFDRKTRTLRPGRECDCSSSCGAIAAIAGYPIDLADPFWTGNFVTRMLATGLFRAIRFTTLAKVKPGDFVVGPGHVVFVRDKTRWWSAEADERGKSAGGRPGDQTGRETRYRAPYGRAKGWTTIVRLISPTVFLRQAIDAYAAGKSTTEPLRLLRLRAPWDGPRWTWLLDTWARWDRGVNLTFTPPALTPAGHAFVVLGSALSITGKPTEKYRQRLALAAQALHQHPASKVLISGGAPRAGVTEAEAGRRWLIDAGIDPARILIEDTSSSTVGNARASIPILRRHATSYTLVSHASHLRRAAILFAARTVQIETVENRHLDLDLAGLLAVDDYTPRPIKPALPVTPTTRRTVAGDVRALLNL